VVRNRFGSGFIFYRSGFDGCMSWTFQRPIGNPFDDFTTSDHAQPCLNYPDPEHPGENLDTPQWEGLRQGWLDYRYAATLAQALTQALKTPGRNGRARRSRSDIAEAEQEFAALLAGMPWNGDLD